MAILSTGPIENNRSLGNGSRPTQMVTVKIVNQDPVSPYDVLILGYYLDNVRTLYVEELLSVGTNQVITKDYYADFDAFEYVFTTFNAVESSAQISVWGKNSKGQLVAPHRLVSREL